MRHLLTILLLLSTTGAQQLQQKAKVAGWTSRLERAHPSSGWAEYETVVKLRSGSVRFEVLASRDEFQIGEIVNVKLVNNKEIEIGKKSGKTQRYKLVAVEDLAVD